MSDVPAIEPAAVDAAIARAHAHVREIQARDGSWPGGAIAGPDSTAEAVIGLAFAGALDPADARKAARRMLAWQLPDGSFAPYEDGPGTRDQTAIVYAALLRAGEDPGSAVCVRALRYVDERGGLAAADLYTRVLLVAGGVLPPSALAAMPVAWVLIPGIERLLGARFTPAFTQIFMMLPALIRGLGRRGRMAPPGSLEAVEDARVVRYVARHQNPTGNLFGAINTTVMAILTYVALGLTPADDRLRRAIDDLKQWRRESDDALEFVTFDSRVWNTALLVTALRQAGVPVDDPGLARAADYMITRQSFWPLPRDWQNPALLTPRTGGWPFQDRNPYGADCDSTSEVLQALAHLGPHATRVQTAIDAGLRWLYGMQSADGGWPAFARGQRGKDPGPFPITALDPPRTLVDTVKMIAATPIHLGDPSTEDVTGRVLQGLGALGARAGDRRVAPAVRFLRAQLDPRVGAWWGRWECNYLACSAEVLAGLVAVGVDVSRAPYADVIAWMLARQNPDGGWGETVDTYADPSLAGTGASSQYVTGIVATTLIAAGHARSPALARAVARLLEIQRRDGAWDGGPYQFVVQWPWPFYRLETTATIYPLRALTAYRNAIRSSP